MLKRDIKNDLHSFNKIANQTVINSSKPLVDNRINDIGPKLYSKHLKHLHFFKDKQNWLKTQKHQNLNQNKLDKSMDKIHNFIQKNPYFPSADRYFQKNYIFNKKQLTNRLKDDIHRGFNAINNTGHNPAKILKTVTSKQKRYNPTTNTYQNNNHKYYDFDNRWNKRNVEPLSSRKVLHFINHTTDLIKHPTQKMKQRYENKKVSSRNFANKLLVNLDKNSVEHRNQVKQHFKKMHPHKSVKIAQSRKSSLAEQIKHREQDIQR